MKCSGRNQNGFAMLIVLMAVVILLMLTFVQINTLFGPSLPSTPAGIEQHPWILEDLLVPEGQGVTLPRKSKLQLDETLTLAALVNRNEAERGRVQLTFETDGRIQGQWECIYDQSGIRYRIDTQMHGNINAKRTYSDENGKDKSRLFFIARGPYTKIPTGANPGVSAERGTAWLTGWIGTDRDITGHVTITTDEQWAAAYAFSSPE